MVPVPHPKTLQAIIRGKISANRRIHSDGWLGYHGLVDVVGYDKQYRLNMAMMSLLVATMVLNLLGVLPNADWPNLMA
jgi:hypothetical protein